MFWPCETRTSICRNLATISSGLYRFLAITVLLDVKDIPQVGPLQWGWINLRAPCTRYRQCPQFASPDVLYGCWHSAEHYLHPASEQISECRRFAAIRNVDHVDAGHHLEQLARQMACRSVATRAHVDLARILFGISNKLGNCLRRDRWVYRHNEGNRDDA